MPGLPVRAASSLTREEAHRLSSATRFFLFEGRGVGGGGAEPHGIALDGGDQAERDIMVVSGMGAAFGASGLTAGLAGSAFTAGLGCGFFFA